MSISWLRCLRYALSLFLLPEKMILNTVISLVLSLHLCRNMHIMILKDPSMNLRRYLKYYNKNIPDIKGKTILVKQEDLSPQISTVERIKAIYPHNIEIVDDEEIINAIASNRPNTLILHKVGPMGDRKTGYCFVMLIGVDDYEMYYYNLHLVDKANPNGLLPDDLKRLGK